MKNRASVGRAALSPPPSIGAHRYTAAWGHAALREDVNLGGNVVNLCRTFKTAAWGHAALREGANLGGNAVNRCRTFQTAGWGHPALRERAAPAHRKVIPPGIKRIFAFSPCNFAETYTALEKSMLY